jgi:putative flippase GtrA
LTVVDSVDSDPSRGAPFHLIASLRSRVRSKHLKFVFIGIYNTAFGYGAFAALHEGFPRLNYMLVLIVSREISVVSAFVAYRLFVFKVKGALVHDFMRFWLVYSGAMVANLIALPFFVEIIGLNVLLAQAITMILTVMSSWVGHNYFSFKRAGADDETKSALEIV